MRRMMLVAVVAIMLTVGLTFGTPRSAVPPAHAPASSQLIVDGSVPNGTTCGGSVGAWC
ncbi:MAG TPA: hypothetical protein VF808_08630 [Ktedonobacterales bacterium]